MNLPLSRLELASAAAAVLTHRNGDSSLPGAANGGVTKEGEGEEKFECADLLAGG
jgi:hypothetical protein